MFRLVIKEKLLHVMTRLQSLLASQWKNVSPLPIPDMLHLNNMASDVVASLNLADKLTSRYETARLMLGLKLKMGEAGVIHLIGVGYRCWDDPTLPLDQAMSTGMQYKGFQLDFAHASSSGTMPGRFSAMSETVQVSITYLQKQMKEEAGPALRWCDFIISLPPIYNSVLNQLHLPNWFSHQCLEGIIQDIKKSRKLVNITQPGDQEQVAPPKLPPLQVRDESGHLKNIENITVNFNKVVIKDGKSEPDDSKQHFLQGRTSHGYSTDSAKTNSAPSGVRSGVHSEEAFSMRNSRNYLGARRKDSDLDTRNEHDLLDNNVPSMPAQELLLPRHVTPPRFPPTAPQFPAQPYPWQNLSENPGWTKHQQQEQVKVDWHDFAGLQEQVKEQTNLLNCKKTLKKPLTREQTTEEKICMKKLMNVLQQPPNLCTTLKCLGNTDLCLKNLR